MLRRRDGAGVERGRGREAGIRVPGPGGGAVCEVGGDDHPLDADAPGASVLPSGTPVIRSWQGGATGAPKFRRASPRSTPNEDDPAACGTGRGCPILSPPQALDPRLADLGDPDVETVDAGLEWTVRCRHPDEDIDQVPARAAGVSAVIRAEASSVIRSQTWRPSGASSASNQQVPFGSRVESGFSRRPANPPACLRSRLPTAVGHRAGLCGCRRSPLRAVRVAPNGTPPPTVPPAVCGAETAGRRGRLPSRAPFYSES